MELLEDALTDASVCDVPRCCSGTHKDGDEAGAAVKM